MEMCNNNNSAATHHMIFIHQRFSSHEPNLNFTEFSNWKLRDFTERSNFFLT